MNRSDLESLAGLLRVNPAVLEKVTRLLEILERIDKQDGVRDRYALKGGTALNLFVLPLPRLSVDIDLNFVHACVPAELKPLRADFVARVERAVQLTGCRFLFAPEAYAGGKLRLRFASALGGEQNLEIDLNFVSRVPILGTIRGKVTIPEMPPVQVNTYSLEELAAGKFAALVSRHAARDHYDAARLLAVRIGLLKDPSFRIAWLIIMAGSREDARRVRTSGLRLNVQEVRQQLIPLLRHSAGVAPPTAEGLALDLERVVQPAIEELLRLLPEEREFLDALLDRGELRPELLTADESLRGRIAAQPMLRWKLRHTRQHLGLDLDSEHGRP